MSLYIGSEIKSIVQKRGMTASEFGRRISKSREGVYSIYRRISIDTDLLKEISQVLEFDFFKFYTPLHSENKRLKEENENLKDTIRLLRGAQEAE